MVIELIWKAGWCISWKYCKAGLGAGKEMLLHDDDDANSTHRWILYIWGMKHPKNREPNEIRNTVVPVKKIQKRIWPFRSLCYVPCNSWYMQRHASLSQIPTISVQLPNHQRLRVQCPNRKHHVKLVHVYHDLTFDFWHPKSEDRIALMS